MKEYSLAKRLNETVEEFKARESIKKKLYYKNKKEHILNRCKEYRNNNKSIVNTRQKDKYKRMRKSLVEILGGQCIRCKTTEKLEISSKDEISYYDRSMRFNGTLGVYFYYLQNPGKAKEDLFLNCSSHRRENTRGMLPTYSEEGKRRQIEKRAKRILPFKNSSIEIILQTKLKEIGIPFKPHKNFRVRNAFHQVDIFIEPNICIEADGEYFHTLIIHKNKKIPIHRDFIIDYELEKQGYKVLRFWSHDIKKNIDWVMNQILTVVRKKRFI